MTFEEALTYSLELQPQIIYLGGKTSTGKSTFAGKLKDLRNYHVVGLDEIVRQDVIKAHGILDEGMAFVQIYKLREQPEWIRHFILAAQERIQHAVRQGKKLVVEGAVAHPDTLGELMSSMPGAVPFYLHPSDLDVYGRNLTSRFMLSHKAYNAGLPDRFWRLVEDSDFEQFCRDRVLTDRLKRAIQEYALTSQQDSNRLLKEQSQIVSNIVVINI